MADRQQSNLSSRLIMQIVILVVAQVAGRADVPPVNSKSARTPVLGWSVRTPTPDMSVFLGRVRLNPAASIRLTCEFRRKDGPLSYNLEAPEKAR
jgi:hypothetical protein